MTDGIVWDDSAEELIAGLDQPGDEHALDDLTVEQTRSLTVRAVSDAMPAGGRMGGALVPGPPLPVSEDLAGRAKQRYLQFIDDQLRAMALDSLRVYADILHSDTAELRLKKSVADTVLDRALGKSPDKIQLTMETKPWQKMLMGIVFDDEFFDRNSVSDLRAAAVAEDECGHRDWSGKTCGRSREPGSPLCKQHSRVWQNGQSPEYPWADGDVIDGETSG